MSKKSTKKSKVNLQKTAGKTNVRDYGHPFADIIPERRLEEVKEEEKQVFGYNQQTKFSDALDSILSIKEMSTKLLPFDLSEFFRLNEEDLMSSTVTDYVFNKDNCIEFKAKVGGKDLTNQDNLYVKITRFDGLCEIETKNKDVTTKITVNNTKEFEEKINTLCECLSQVLLQKLNVFRSEQ